MAKQNTRIVVAKRDLSENTFAQSAPALISGSQYVAKGKDVWRNGEFWTNLDNGFKYPSSLFKAM